MVYYRMPYYNPYQEAMLVHYSPSFGRSVGASSAFASGDAVAAGTLLRGKSYRYPLFFNTHFPWIYTSMEVKSIFRV